MAWMVPLSASFSFSQLSLSSFSALLRALMSRKTRTWPMESMRPPPLRRGDPPVSDALGQSGEPLLSLPELRSHARLVVGHLDGDLELALIERLKDIAEGLGDLGPLEGMLVGGGGELDNRDAVGVPDLFGDGSSV